MRNQDPTQPKIKSICKLFLKKKKTAHTLCRPWKLLIHLLPWFPQSVSNLQCQSQVEYFRIGRAVKMAEEKDAEHIQITAICRATKPGRTLWGSWVWSLFFLSPISYSKTPASTTFPKFQGQIRTIAHQGRSSQEITWGKIKGRRTSLVAQWLRLQTSRAGAESLISGLRTKILHHMWPKKLRKRQRLGVTREAHKIRRLTTWDPAHTLISSATLSLNHWYDTLHQIPPGWDTVFKRRRPLCILLLGKVIPKTLSLMQRSQAFGITTSSEKDGNLPGKIFYSSRYKERTTRRVGEGGLTL